MNAGKPRAVFRDNHLVLAPHSGAQRFEIEFRNMTPNCFVTLDCYPSFEPSHPKRHMAWFRFTDIAAGSVEFAVSWQDGRIGIERANGEKAAECWYGPSPLTQAWPFSIRVAIRSTDKHALVFEDKLIVFESAEAFADNRQAVQPAGGETGVPLTGYAADRRLYVAIALKSLRRRDAVGNLAWQQLFLLRRLGLSADLFVSDCDDQLRPEVRHIGELAGLPETSPGRLAVLYHHSIADADLDWVAALPCKKIAYFHGVTDASFFKVFDAELAEHCRLGMAQCQVLPGFDGIIANSRFSLNRCIAAQPEAGGVMPPTLICPPLLGAFGRLADPVGLPTVAGPYLLYVGRIFPHKRIEDLIEILKAVGDEEPAMKLVLAGSSHFAYRRYLEHLVGQLAADLRQRVVWLNSVPDADLSGLYRHAAAYVSTSRDEGFGIPLLEAMHCRTPVVAAAAGAVPEVLAGAGKLFVPGDAATAAFEILRLHNDSRYREQVLARQNERMQALGATQSEQQFLDFLLGVFYGL